MDRIAAKINKLSEESKQSTIREIIQSSESNFILSGMAACNRISSIVFQCFELIRLVIQLVRCCLKINSMPHIRLRALCEIQFCLVLFIYFQTQFGTFFDTCKLPLKKIKTDMALKTLILFLSISIDFPFILIFRIGLFPAMMLLDIAWLSLGVVWLYKFYMIVDIGEAREIMLGKSAIF